MHSLSRLLRAYSDPVSSAPGGLTCVLAKRLAEQQVVHVVRGVVGTEDLSMRAARCKPMPSLMVRGGVGTEHGALTDRLGQSPARPSPVNQLTRHAHPFASLKRLMHACARTDLDAQPRHDVLQPLVQVLRLHLVEQQVPALGLCKTWSCRHA